WQAKLAERGEPVAFYGRNPLKRTTQVQRLSYNLGRERTQALQTIAAREDLAAGTIDASLFNIFAALLGTYLYLISGNRRVVFGTFLHNRRSKAFKETIGLFVEMLPLGVTIDEHDTFRSLVKKVKGEMVGA